MREVGAILLPNSCCHFRLWAPFSKNVHLHITEPQDRVVPMEPREFGYHEVTLDNVGAGTRYVYRLESGEEFPDPASRFQPEGVHGPSEVVAISPPQRTSWFGLPLETYVIYELHVGTFTKEGTFEAIIPYLDYLANLGVTAIELMPIAQFPGGRNWGYDGVFMFAAQNTYGGPAGLKKLVDACHQRNLAVVLDVVYNHIGPEGNYLPRFAPYFTDRYKTPWGPALNFDDADSDEVRSFFITNAVYWIRDFQIDALRLDAVHAILDHSALNILEELTQAVHEEGTRLNRRVYAIAESALNDTRLVRSTELGGYGLDGQWNDDFHHALHTLITGESGGYYVDFGGFQQMAQAFSEGFVYSGNFSRNRRRRHGNSSRSVPPAKFVVYAKNHDQIGNRMMGERLSELVSIESYKLAQSTVLLSPFIPLLFMGDEYGETAPFQYFVSHSDPQLVEAVRKGRKEEFASFDWTGEPPDPQDEATFLRCRLSHDLRKQDRHKMLLEFHRELIRLRQAVPALAYLSKDKMDIVALEDQALLMARRWHNESEVLLILNFSGGYQELVRHIPVGVWQKALDSTDSKWSGPGSTVPDVLYGDSGAALKIPPKAVVLFEKEIKD